MSTASCLLSEEQVLCSICLNVFTDPVALPCGHNFCKACIVQHWDDNHRCDCPFCKEHFYRQLNVQVNGFISDVAAQFSQSSGKTPRQAAGPGDIPCDICTKTQMKAVKSCLVCLASYCQVHLSPHLTAPCLERHRLIDAVDDLKSRMCVTHNKPLELFCKTDQECICMLCPILEHKSHEVTQLSEVFTTKKVELDNKEAEVNQMIQERRLKVEDIRQSAKLNKAAANRERADGAQVFLSILQSLETSWLEFTDSIAEKEKMMKTEAKGLIKEIKQEVSELLKKQDEMEQLSLTKDHLQFLQGFGAMKTFEPTKDWTEVCVNLPSYEGTVRRTVDHLDVTLGKDLRKQLRETELNSVQRFAVDVTLDPNTAHPALILSDDGKQVYHGSVRKNLPDNPGRFNPSCCVLAKQSFSSGKFYFEVQVKDKTRWTLGVAGESIRRKGIIPLCPENGHWTVWLKDGGEYAALVGSPRRLSLKSEPLTVGVFVDYEKGLVAFHDVDATTPIFSFIGCTFTERLYPFFSPGLNNDGVNSAPIVIVSHSRIRRGQTI
ncbi:E3 ubiquitin-protein ligase TRIM39-like [Antennarius striatus]|uniref:E3 ubiquitin-protein ligase TRIM39-like n=1 Tax=Antennarius striatus TaxID=241820 RepID=UPI0035B455D6